MTRTELHHFWHQTLADWAAFCKEQSLTYHQFVYWRQKLRGPGESAGRGHEPASAAGFARVAPVDCRKQAHGLALIVEQELGHSPFTGALYAFTNRQRNKIKCLMGENNGFVLYYKALARQQSELAQREGQVGRFMGAYRKNTNKSTSSAPSRASTNASAITGWSSYNRWPPTGGTPLRC